MYSGPVLHTTTQTIEARTSVGCKGETERRVNDQQNTTLRVALCL